VSVVDVVVVTVEKRVVGSHPMLCLYSLSILNPFSFLQSLETFTIVATLYNGDKQYTTT
jgi:hypothetical protein